MRFRTGSIALSRTRPGQALVEMALCLPLLIIVFAAVVDLGYLTVVHLSITTAMREAMLAGSKESQLTATDIQNILLSSQTTANLEASNITVLLSTNSPDFASGRSITIGIAYTHAFLFLRLIDQKMSVDLRMKMVGPRYSETGS